MKPRLIDTERRWGGFFRVAKVTTRGGAVYFEVQMAEDNDNPETEWEPYLVPMDGGFEPNRHATLEAAIELAQHLHDALFVSEEIVAS